MIYKVYYWRNKRGWFIPPEETAGNFGDMLTPKILDYFNIEYEYIYNTDYNMLVVGSIAKLAKPDTIVLGSGFMKFDDYVEPKADYRFVRGPISRNKILENNIAVADFYGDPGFLLPLFVDESKKLYDIGFIPHWTQYDFFKKQNPKLHIINVWQEDCLEVVKQITECRHIISNSLHGLVVASAYSIPAAWAEFSGLKNGRDKFIDFYESINLKNITPSTNNSNLKFYKNTLSKANIDAIVELFKDL